MERIILKNILKIKLNIFCLSIIRIFLLFLALDSLYKRANEKPINCPAARTGYLSNPSQRTGMKRKDKPRNSMQ